VNNAEDILPNGRRAGAGSRRGPNPEQVETEDYGEAKANMKHSTQEAVGDSLVASNASAEMPAKKATVAKPAAKKPAKKKPAKKSAASSKQAKKTEKGRTLVIVESPAKAKTIEKYLGSKYKVLASMGHLIDLPKSRIGVDVNNNFEPEYLTIRGRASVLKELTKEAKKSEAVMLASDPDREGEAIAFQIGKYLGEKEPALRIRRITFNEITQGAIKAAVDAPRDIELPKVDAQKARRVLDRLVGYNLSPLLWKKVKNGLSAGRVQSATLKLICDRKRSRILIPDEYWTVEAELKLSVGADGRPRALQGREDGRRSKPRPWLRDDLE